MKISSRKSKIYYRTDLEVIRSIFYQVIPVVSHLEVSIPENPNTLKNIGESHKGIQKKFWKEDLFVHYDKNNDVILL